jgi:hypothetical protein
MKRIGIITGKPDLAAALGDLEASRAARTRHAPSGPTDAPGSPKRGGGVVASLERSRAVQKAAEAAQLEALARKAGMPPDAAARLADGLRSQVPNEWTFIMLSPSQNAAVVRWIMENSKRSSAAVRLWAHLFEVIRNDTGEVLKSRSDLAAHLGIEPDNLTRIMSELVSINAIRREKRGREVRYFMNATIATHLPGPAARKAAREADGPLMVLMRGGKANAAAE